MSPRFILPFLAVLFALSLQPVSAAGAEAAKPAVRRLLPGHWIATLVLPSGVKISDDQKIRSDGFATGRIVVYYRDGSVKYSYTYNCSWRVDGKILVSEDIVSAPKRQDLPDTTRDEILQVDARILVLRDLANGIVAHYTRIP